METVGVTKQSRSRRNHILTGICLRRDIDGIKLALNFNGRDRVICLIKAKEKPMDTPTLPLVEDITKKGTGRIFDTEDIEFGEMEPARFLDPEEIGNVN